MVHVGLEVTSLREINEASTRPDSIEISLAR